MSLNIYEALKAFAYFPREQRFQDLAVLAEQENWDYRHHKSNIKLPILHNYLHHTFARINEEKKVVYSSSADNACFNTGLVTANQEQIFAYFIQNRNLNQQPWFLSKFCKESDRDLRSFEKLPEIAHYFDDPSELLFNPKFELRKNVDHIIDDNRNRFPEPFASMKDNHSLRITLNGAIEHAISRAQRNYKTAIPQYYQNKIQLLLPLCLKEPLKADLALVVYKQGNIYLSSTCLTLDQAYNNARLLARPDTDWLEP